MTVKAFGFARRVAWEEFALGDVVVARLPSGARAVGVVGTDDDRDYLFVGLWAEDADCSHFPVAYELAELRESLGKIDGELVLEPREGDPIFPVGTKTLGRGLFLASGGALVAAIKVDLYGGERMGAIDLDTGQRLAARGTLSALTSWRVGISQAGRKETFWLP
ncbi:hypothetical protein [Brevundimonas goettingensis]|uniref:Uncharacterized protein n=1 Tax=Brevundimonas goettingensis TaxID=2774190 RepID=A0A975GUP8_9CAUL|nr:hypothetical protein [Brevundimonas goettingensis]QTC90462.1 hypothetical protein IFJ75_14420 [Brevundimonas goettingensis]